MAAEDTATIGRREGDVEMVPDSRYERDLAELGPPQHAPMQCGWPVPLRIGRCQPVSSIFCGRADGIRRALWDRAYFGASSFFLLNFLVRWGHSASAGVVTLESIFLTGWPA
jgi:hypothetical protein